jgi:hypothetical protein
LSKAYHDEDKKKMQRHDNCKDNDSKDLECPKDINNTFQDAAKTIRTIFKGVATSKNRLQ